MNTALQYFLCRPTKVKRLDEQGEELSGSASRGQRSEVRD
jgi:hypothetical protein